MSKTSKPVTKPETEASPFKELVAVGEIDPGGNTKILVRHVEIAGKKEGEKARRVLDIRQHIKSPRYTGFGKGISIPDDQVEELRDMLTEFLDGKRAAAPKAKKIAKTK